MKFSGNKMKMKPNGTFIAKPYFSVVIFYYLYNNKKTRYSQKDVA